MGVNGIYGLSGSGIDIESMVKVGMMSKQKEYDKMQQTMTKNEWTKEAYNNIYSDLSTFNYGNLSSYKMQSTMNAMKASSNNTSAISVSANGSAVSMTHKVQVNELASNAYMMSANKIVRGDESNLSTSINLSAVLGVDSAYELDGYSGKEFAITNTTENSDGTATITLEADDGNGGTFPVQVSRSAIKSDGTYDYTWTDSSGQSQSRNGTSLAKIADKYAMGGKVYSGSDKAVSFMVTDGASTAIDTMTTDDKQKLTVSYSFGEIYNKTLNDLVSDINGLGTNVKASYDSVNDVFSLYNGEGGSDNGIQLTMNNDGAAKLFNNLQLAQSKDGELVQEDGATKIFSFAKTSGSPEGGSADTNGVMGSNGKVTIDGREYTNIENNRITVSGVTYTLLDKTSSAATVTVTQDTDAIIDKVKSFVDDYNKILDNLYEKYTEKQYSDYKPLTDAQKESMTEEQIKKWEEKAKSGLLNHSEVVGKIISNMREALSTPISGLSGKYNSAYSLGIDTTKTNGHIALDEDKLKQALAADPEAVYKVFGTLDKNDSFEGNGVAQRLGDVMVNSMKEVKSYAGETASVDDDSTLGNLMRELQTKMSNFQTLLKSFEDSLYKKYDSMEVTLMKLGVQLNYITGGQ